MIHGCGTWVGDLDGQEARDQGLSPWPATSSRRCRRTTSES